MKKILGILLVSAIGTLSALVIATRVTGSGDIATFVSGSDPLLLVAVIAAGLAFAAFAAGTVSGDYSWVDRLWSTAPVAFAWIYAASYGFALHVTLLAILVTLWGARLTFNFARRGGYTSMEDYRWPILRKRIGNEVLWHLFSLVFVSGFQVGLFVLFTLPLRAVGAQGSVPVLGLGIAAVLAIAALLFETISDQQQWVFQGIKHRKRAAGADGQAPGADPALDQASSGTPAWFGSSPAEREAAVEADVRRGFLTHGLFSMSRHPNYFGELGFWWAIYIASASGAGAVLHWSGIGALVLSALFVGSTVFTESISAARYPAYAEYQASVSAIVPLPSRGPLEDAATADGQ